MRRLKSKLLDPGLLYWTQRRSQGKGRRIGRDPEENAIPAALRFSPCRLCMCWSRRPRGRWCWIRQWVQSTSNYGLRRPRRPPVTSYNFASKATTTEPSSTGSSSPSSSREEIPPAPELVIAIIRVSLDFIISSSVLMFKTHVRMANWINLFLLVVLLCFHGGNNFCFVSNLNINIERGCLCCKLEMAGTENENQFEF